MHLKILEKVITDELVSLEKLSISRDLEILEDSKYIDKEDATKDALIALTVTKENILYRIKLKEVLLKLVIDDTSIGDEAKKIIRMQKELSIQSDKDMVFEIENKIIPKLKALLENHKSSTKLKEAIYLGKIKDNLSL